MALDAEKAFDRLEPVYLQALLKYMGFCPAFLQVISTLYDKPKAQLSVNQCYSHDFFLTRGTRQGCPLSPILFALSLEPLAYVIRSTSEISGVTIGNECYKLNMFADDMVIYLSNPLSSISHLITSIDDFGQLSGFSINYGKSEIYPIVLPPIDKQAIESTYNFQWVHSVWRHLGIFIPLKIKDLFAANPIIVKMTALFKKWNTGLFTWLERLELVKSILFPQFLFLFQTLPVEITQATLRKWQSFFTSFIWNKKRPRISFQQLSRLSTLGGFGLPDRHAYYLAPQLWASYSFLSSESAGGWRYCEQLHVAPYAIRDVIWNKHKDRPHGLEANPYLAFTLKIWDACRRVLAPDISPISSFLGQVWFPPALAPNSLEVWRSHGMSRLQDVLSHGVLHTKQSLEDKYKCKLSWYEFMQLDHLFKVSNFESVLNWDLTYFEVMLRTLNPTLRGFI